MDWINKAVVGDNLEIMKALPSNSIDLIYCDILYGTGRDFGDYQDLKANRKDIETFYIPRIEEMHRLLKDTGSIYLQMDTRINHWLRCIMDDVFGYDRFLNEIRVQKRTNGQNVKTSHFVKNSDVILFYSKSKNKVFNNQYRPLSNEGKKRYHLDVDGRKAQFKQLVKKGGYIKKRTLVFKGKSYTGKYVWTQETLDKRIKEGVIIQENSKGDLGYCIFLDKSKGVQFDDFWSEFTYAENLNLYKTQKPEKLLHHIIKSSSNKGDIVADFFCGSGTTAKVANELGRNYFACDLNPKAIEITNSRITNDLFSTV